MSRLGRAAATRCNLPLKSDLILRFLGWPTLFVWGLAVLVLGSVVVLCCLDAEDALLIIMQRRGNVNGGNVRLSNYSIKNRNHTARTLHSTVVVIRQF